MSELPSDDMSMEASYPDILMEQWMTRKFEEWDNDKITIFLDNEMIKLLDRF